MKKFLIIGSMNAITYKSIFPLIKDNKMWLGDGKNLDFILSDGTIKGVPSRWLTNLDHKKRHEPIDLYKHYNSNEFPHYDNYNAVNVDKVCEIPMDYDGIMGVPISFLDKYCPEQFQIIDIWNDGTSGDVFGAQRCKIETSRKGVKCYEYFKGPIINGKAVYKRLLIKRKNI